MSDAPKPPRITVVYFNRSVNICGEERDSASLPMSGQAHQPGNVVDSIEPVTVLSDGTFERSGKPANGLLLSRRRHSNAANKQLTARTFVPFGDVRCVAYAAQE
jgi:hypothetical protein